MTMKAETNTLYIQQKVYMKYMSQSFQNEVTVALSQYSDKGLSTENSMEVENQKRKKLRGL